MAGGEGSSRQVIAAVLNIRETFDSGSGHTGTVVFILEILFSDLLNLYF